MIIVDNQWLSSIYKCVIMRMDTIYGALCSKHGIKCFTPNVAWYLHRDPGGKYPLYIQEHWGAMISSSKAQGHSGNDKAKI